MGRYVFGDGSGERPNQGRKEHKAGKREPTKTPQQPAGRIARLSADAADDAANLFKALGEPSRLQILFFLSQRDEINVTALCEMLGQTQPGVSHHLAKLRQAGLIVMRRDGKQHLYCLNGPKLQGRLKRFLGSFSAGNSRFRLDGFQYGNV